MGIVRKILSNRMGQITIACVLTGFVTTLFLSETHIIKRDKEIQIVEKEVIKVVTETKTVTKKVYINKISHEKLTKHREVFSDGRIIEDEIFESSSKQISRIQEQDKKHYESAMADRETKYNEKISELEKTTNPKHLTIYIGASINKDYVAGFTYKLWGPVTIGGEASKINNSYLALPTIGLTF